MDLDDIDMTAESQSETVLFVHEALERLAKISAGNFFEKIWPLPRANGALLHENEIGITRIV